MSTVTCTRPPTTTFEQQLAASDLGAVPAAVQDRLLAEHADRIADHMANHFARRSPTLSARSGFARWQRVAGVALVLIVGAAVVITPGAAVLVLALFTLLITLGHYVISIAGLRSTAGCDDRKADPAIADGDLPTYTIIVPAYHEEAVIGDMVHCLARIDYPRHLLEALILVERRDDATKAAIAAADPAPFIRVVEIPPGVPQTKPRSCNAGLLLAKGELLVIFDAEDRPEPDQLRIAAARFAAGSDRLACVQAKLLIHNVHAGFVAEQFALEYCMRYETTLPGLARLGLPIPLGGTSNHFRTRVLRELGGWDAWNVTEDADLGMRCRALGYDVDVIDSVTWGEAPTEVAAWIRQRTRWLKGFMLTALVHTRSPRQTWRAFRPTGALTMLFFLAGTPLLFLSQSVLLGLNVSGYDGITDTDLPTDHLVVATQLGMLVGYVAIVGLAARRRGLVRAVFAPLVPIYWVMHWCADWRALHQLIRAPFVWEKTPHGSDDTVRTVQPATATAERLGDELTLVTSAREVPALVA